MVYTLTLNPSLDYIIKIKDFRMGIVNRTSEELILPGGKGLNVSCVLRNLKCESEAIGFFAGFIGEEIERLLVEKGVSVSCLHVSEGISRINVKVRAADGDALENDSGQRNKEETEINGMGPVIGEKELALLFEKLGKLVSGDFLVLAGSIPGSLPKTIYADIMRRLSGLGIQFVVDATGEGLLKVLPYKPFLIKPNHHELGELFGIDLMEMSHGDLEILKANVKQYAAELQKLGARNVLVSMGGMGALLVTQEGDCLYVEAPEGKVVNSVGAGDSMVAGFLAGYMQKMSEDGENADMKQVYLHALRMGICAGSASAFSAELATRDEVMQLFHRYL